MTSALLSRQAYQIFSRGSRDKIRQGLVDTLFTYLSKAMRGLTQFRVSQYGLDTWVTVLSGAIGTSPPKGQRRHTLYGEEVAGFRPEPQSLRHRPTTSLLLGILKGSSTRVG